MQPSVAIIYDGFPHYRGGVIEELGRSEKFKYFFFCDRSYRDPSIPLYKFKSWHNIFYTKSFQIGPFYFQFGLLSLIFSKKINHCIFLGNPYFLMYWLYVPLLRLTGRKVYFWTHGWIDESEPALRRTIRNIFYKLADRLLLYGNRAKKIGISYGFSEGALSVVHNSLDYEAQSLIFKSLTDKSQAELRSELGLPLDHKFIICTARMTRKCRFDVLIHSINKLVNNGGKFFILFIGDGPELSYLKKLASDCNVHSRFYGACYDEVQIARFYKASDLAISPGKVGLTAIHSMAYGTPVITHENFNHQMPECEAILTNLTGSFFVENSSDSLAQAIDQWFLRHPEKQEQVCIERVESMFTPAVQRQKIEDALLSKK